MVTRRKSGDSGVAALTLEVLRGIREDLREGLGGVRTEIRATNERLDQTNERLDQTNERLDRLERRQGESEVRLATELVAVAHAVDAVKDLLSTRLEVRDRVVEHETRLTAIERKLGIAS